MIEIAKITGDVLDNKIQVTVRTGESFFAPMAILGTAVTAPSEKWIKENKDNFMALVTYEKNNYITPIIMGFYPLKGSDSSSYNTSERLIEVLVKLVEQLSKGKINTQLGPQQFMPDTQKVLSDLKKELEEIKKLILTIDI